MSEYIRTTRECSVSQLHPEILKVIRNHFREHQLGNVESETLLCCETISRKKNDGKITSWLSGNPDTTIHTGMLLTSQWFVWVHYGDKSGALLNAADLSKIRAEFHTSLFAKDPSLEIVGYLGEANTRVHGYIGIGTEPAAQKFCEEVRQATLKANPPARKGLFKWLSD